MSVNPRPPGFWDDARRMSGYFDDAETEGLVPAGEDEEMGVVHDGRTPLDRTIDKIGMGSYQWTLLSLCGFGWLADNMWIQAIAIILPRVQQHFDIPDARIGVLSSSMFGGMMFGAVGWGTCSDLLGRTAAFNATLFLTSVFGVLAALASTFPLLCISLFLLGSAVGGSMPTDGTLLLEHMPNGKQYLVTALSVFFSFGSVISAVIGLLVIPSHSCPPAPEPCDVASQNMGWKYLLVALGLLTLVMFLARMVFFRLHESPRYLVHAGRTQEAIESLQLISKFNGDELALDPEDVRDHLRPSEVPPPPREVVFDADAEPEPGKVARPPMLSQKGSRQVLRPEGGLPDYSSTGSPSGSGSTPDEDDAKQSASPEEEQENEDDVEEESRGRSGGRSAHTRTRSTSSFDGVRSCVYWALPRAVRRPLYAWRDRVAMVLAPAWLRTTLLVWVVWCAMSLAYTMFNVYLPKLLEGRGSDSSTPKTLTDSLWDVVIYSIGGCPGAILGAWLVDSRLGRRWSLAGSTFATALFCMLFVAAQSSLAVRVSTMGISLSATAMWAVLYGWTPEIFGTKVRGTACGIASALSRIGGMIAPLLGGALLMADAAFPVYAAVVIFVVAGVCVLMLRESAGARGASAGMMH